MLRLLVPTACLVTMMHCAPAWAGPVRLADEVRRRSPELAELANRVDEARSRIAPAGTWPDPRVSVEVMDAPTLGGPRAGVSQMVPLRGQPGWMARMAELEADMREAELAERMLMLTAEAAQALFELAYVQRAGAIVEANRDLTGRMARVSESKYAVGKGMQADVLRAHVAKTRLLEPKLVLQARRRAALARLGVIVPGWNPGVPELKGAPRLPSVESYWRAAEQHSPMLKMRRLAVAHAEAGLELARRERWPDLDLGIAAGRSMPGDMPYVGGMVGASLPIWWTSKQQPRVAAAESKLAAEAQALETASRRLRAELEATHAEAAQTEAQLTLYRGGLLAQARQAFLAALAAYQVNQGDFLMILDAQMALNDVQMDEAMAIAERLKMEAMLEALAGREPHVETKP